MTVKINPAIFLPKCVYQFKEGSVTKCASSTSGFHLEPCSKRCENAVAELEKTEPSWRMRSSIKCAATRHGDHIIAGKHHGECLAIADNAGFHKADFKFGQGFLTKNMRFVLRKEALQIAKYHDQIVNKHKPDDILLSEDLR